MKRAIIYLTVLSLSIFVPPTREAKACCHAPWEFDVYQACNIGPCVPDPTFYPLVGQLIYECNGSTTQWGQQPGSADTVTVDYSLDC